MNIVIAGGGTGGHVFPALAVAKELTKIFLDAKITFVGTLKGIESKIIPKEGYEIRFIRSEGVVGKNIIRTISALFRIPFSLRDAYKILRDIKPSLVLGVGGYSSGPVTLCAQLMGIPTIIHEQNAVPGLANRILGKFVDAIAISYQESMKFFPREKTFLTGNPVREEILKGSRERGYSSFSLDSDRFTLFIFGGSRGAHHINSVIRDALQFLEPLRDRIQFLHQTGENDFHRMGEMYRTRGFRGTVVPFAYQMADAYAVAELVIARAGATTLAELTACGKAAILIPYPHAAGNHQEINAKKLWDIGAAKMILDKDLDGKSLADMITHLFDNPGVILEMERISKSIGRRDARGKIMEIISGLLKKKGGERGIPCEMGRCMRFHQY